MMEGNCRLAMVLRVSQFFFFIQAIHTLGAMLLG